MQLVLEQISDRLHFDGQNHWIRCLDRFHKYDRLEKLPEEDYVPVDKITITKKVELKGLPTKQEKQISSEENHIVDQLSEDQRAKPISPNLVKNQALEAFYGGS